MSRAAGLLFRLGAACQRSCSALAEVASASASMPSCSYRTITSSVGRACMPWTSPSGPIMPFALSGAIFGDQQLSRAYSKRPKPQAFPDYFVTLGNLRDNPGATRPRIRLGRGDRSRRGNFCGRGMNGQKSRGRGLHMLFDGGQLGFLKFPVTRQRPPYETLYYQLGISRVVEFVQLGLLDPSRTITMKELYDTGCVTSNIKYGVLLYGKARLAFPLDIQVTAVDADTRGCVEAAGGSVTRVYYTQEGLGAILHPEKYTSRRLPLPPPAPRWHPKYDKKFDVIGAIPPAVEPNAALLAAAAPPRPQLTAKA